MIAVNDYFKKRGKDILQLVGIVRDNLDKLERAIEESTDSIEGEEVTEYFDLKSYFNGDDFESFVSYVRYDLSSFLRAKSKITTNEEAIPLGKLYFILRGKVNEMSEIMLYAVEKNIDCEAMTEEEKNKRETANDTIASLYGMEKAKNMSELKELAMMEVVYTVYRVWVNIDTHGLKKGLVKFYEEMEKRDSGAEKTFYKDLNLLLEDSEDELDEYVEEIAEDTEIMDESDDWMDDEECLRG